MIVTIITIIILAGITIFSGLNTPDSGNLAKFVSEFTDITLSVKNNYVKKFTEYSIDGKNRKDAQIYYEIASGIDVGEYGVTSEAATVNELGITTYSNKIDGNQYFEVLDSNKGDINLENWVGYSTRYGDSVGDFSPCSQLTVTEIKEIGRIIGLPTELIDKVPSDGLCGKTDEDNLGFSYAVLDRYIREGICEDEEVKKRIDTLHQKNLFKLQLMPSWTLGTSIKSPT